MKKILLSLAVLGLLIAGNANAKVNTYFVQAGDTLCGIGIKFDVSCGTMVANFPGKNPHLIHPGDKFEFGLPDGLLGGLVSKPYTFAPNTIIYSSQVNSNLDTLYTLVNGNLNNANIIAGAAISSTKISGTAIVSTGASNQTINGTTTIMGGLFVSSTTNFLRVPIMTTAQRDALTGIEAGAIIYSTDDAQFYVREGSAWAGITTAAVSALANTTTKGIVQEATTSSIFLGTAVGSTGARNFLSNANIVTTSDYATKAGKVPALRADSQLDSSFGGNPGALAQLDANSKVVQNPASATSTFGTSSTIPLTTASGTIATGWIATSTGDGVNGNFLRSTSTGAFWGNIGFAGASTTGARVIDTVYRNTSTQHNGRTLVVYVTLGLNGGSGTNGQADIYISTSSALNAPVTTLLGSAYLNNNGGAGVSNSGQQTIPIILPSGFYWKATNVNNSAINNVFEMEL